MWDDSVKNIHLAMPLDSLSALPEHALAELGHSRAMLTTQTRSWVGIKCYHGFGFRLMAFFPEEETKKRAGGSWQKRAA